MGLCACYSYGIAGRQERKVFRLYVKYIILLTINRPISSYNVWNVPPAAGLMRGVWQFGLCTDILSLTFSKYILKTIV